MTKYYKNPPPPENYTKPKPPPCPPAPPRREFICNMFGFAESKESISKREGYVKSKDETSNNSDIKQLFEFYGIEYEWSMDTWHDYAKLLEQLADIQAQQIERLQNRLREIEPQKPMNEHHKIRIA